MNKKKVLKEILSWIIMFLIVFIVVTVINSKVFAKYQVQQSSMENTLFTNQQLIVDKMGYNFNEPERGDIIIFLKNEEKGTILDDTARMLGGIRAKLDKSKPVSEKHKSLVKRVIGVEGDEVDIKDGFVYLNGIKLEETYVKGETVTDGFVLPYVVGENELFVMGDHRTVSSDSREFGPIDLKQVEGKVLYRVYPFSQWGKIK